MMDFDQAEFLKGVAAIIREAVDPVKAENAEIRKQIAELRERQPEKGEKGEKGDPGQDAPPVEIDVADVVKELLAADGVKQYLKMEVDAYLTENPPAAGKDGAPGRDGEPGPRGEKGADGKDGLGVSDLLIDRSGELVATFTDGRMKSLGPVVGKDGAPGKDGADFTDVEIDYDGERTITIKSRNGTITKRLPVPMDKGYWREGMAFEKGDIVTHDGNAWLALRDNKSKPCHENGEDWRLFARKGRDGKDGRNGIDKTAPVKVSGDA